MKTQAERVKAYLGPYASKPSQEIRDFFREVDLTKSYFIQSNYNYHNAIITYLLLKDGRKNYQVYGSTDIIQIYMDNHPVIDSMYDLKVPVVFTTVTSLEVPNSRRAEIICELIRVRRSMRLPVIILNDLIMEVDLAGRAENLGLTVMKFGATIGSSSRIILPNSKNSNQSKVDDGEF